MKPFGVFLILYLVLLAPGASAGPSNLRPLDLSGTGGSVGNPAEPSRSNILFAYYQLRSPLLLCLRSEECWEGLSTTEQDWLKEIEESLENEFKAGNEQIIFLDFSGEYRDKIAQTRDEVGNPILFNSRIIDDLGKSGKIIGITQATAILIHELGHHHNKNKNHLALDNLGAKVANYYETSAVSRLRHYNRKNLWATLIKRRDLEENDFLEQLIVHDDQNWINSVKLLDLAKNYPCPAGDRLSAFELNSPVWSSDFSSCGQPWSSNQMVPLLVQGRAHCRRPEKSDSKIVLTYVFRLCFQIDSKRNRLADDAGVEIFSCARSDHPLCNMYQQ